MTRQTSARQTLYNMLYVIEEEIRTARHEYNVSKQIYSDKLREYKDIKFLLEQMDAEIKKSI